MYALFINAGCTCTHAYCMCWGTGKINCGSLLHKPTWNHLTNTNSECERLLAWVTCAAVHHHHRKVKIERGRKGRGGQCIQHRRGSHLPDQAHYCTPLCTIDAAHLQNFFFPFFTNPVQATVTRSLRFTASPVPSCSTSFFRPA